MGRYDVGGVTVEVVEGDITAADTDALINAARDHLCMGSGVGRGKWGA